MLRHCNRRRRMIDRLRSLVLVCALSGFALAALAQTRSANGPRLETGVARSVNATGSTAAQEAEFARARTAAQRILAGAEFQRSEPTLWDRIKEKILDTVIGIFAGINRVSTRSPWVGRTIEWLLFLAAAVGLLVWVMRTVQRQRLRVAMGAEPAKSSAWARQAEDWRRQAEQEAAKGAWREAIHALYWAAIVHLEQHRMWRHNPSRTPREYVRLLNAESEEQRELRGLTSALEQSWYGQREASAEEFAEAQQSFERLAEGTGARRSIAGGNA